jgi:2-oxoglutarate ferredoxin oxidoreductase subunit beta
VFNDGAFDALREKDPRKRNMIMLEAGKPIRFGEENERGVVQRSDGSLELVDVDDVGEDALVVHDPEHKDPSLAFALAHLAERPTGPTPVGVFRSVSRPTYAQGLHEELEDARSAVGDDELAELFAGSDTWTVS